MKGLLSRILGLIFTPDLAGSARVQVTVTGGILSVATKLLEPVLVAHGVDPLVAQKVTDKIAALIAIKTLAILAAITRRDVIAPAATTVTISPLDKGLPAWPAPPAQKAS